MHRHLALLACCVLALVVISFLSVNAPIRFDRERTKRELVVKRQLLQVRRAQQRYFAATGNYCGSLAELVGRGYLPDSLQTVPFSDGRPWRLRVSAATAPSGRQRPAVECGATYDDYLCGLDAESVNSLSVTAQTSGRYPGLRFGDATKPGYTDCNW